MLWGIAVVLVILWLVGWLVFRVAGFFIHILLILAIIALVVRLFWGTPTSPP